MEDYKEFNRLWHLTYHREALHENDIGLVRELYEERIKQLESQIEYLKALMDGEIVIDCGTAPIE